MTFGKGSRLGELFVGSFILGGASKVGTIPDGVSGSIGIGICALCLGGVCWLGVRTGQLTISPVLNTWWKATVVSIFQFLFIAIAVGVVGILRTSITEVGTQISAVGIREMALISLLTLGYMLTVNRTSGLTAEQRAARERLIELRKEMKNMRENKNATPNPRRIISELKEVVTDIPHSQFDDVNKLKSDLESVANSLEKLDHESRVEIISGDPSSEAEHAKSYQEAIIIYNSVFETMHKV